MRIWVQKSVSMQKRTCPLKFGDLAEKSGFNSVSNLSTKGYTARCTCSRPRCRGGGALRALVEKFDTEFNSDFSAKSPNFRGLVLFCIKADFCDQIRIFQHFSKSTRFGNLCTVTNPNFADFCNFSDFKFWQMFKIFVNFH